MEKLNLDKGNLSKFGTIMGIAFGAIGVILLVRNKQVAPLFIISLIFFVAAYFCPSALRLIYIFWMRLAFVLSWVNTRIILFILFYLIFTPVGLVMRLFGVDLLDRKIEKNKNSYWLIPEIKEFNPLDYERQF